MTASKEFSARMRMAQGTMAYMKLSVVKPGLRVKTGAVASTSPPVSYNLFGAQVIRAGVKFAF